MEEVQVPVCGSSTLPVPLAEKCGLRVSLANPNAEVLMIPAGKVSLFISHTFLSRLAVLGKVSLFSMKL